MKQSTFIVGVALVILLYFGSFWLLFSNEFVGKVFRFEISFFKLGISDSNNLRIASRVLFNPFFANRETANQTVSL